MNKKNINKSPLEIFLIKNPKPKGSCFLHDGDSGFSWRYNNQRFPTYDVTSSNLDFLGERRKSLYNDWQEMLQIQKQLGKNKDYQGAKEMKSIASLFRKSYLSTCIVIGRICPVFWGDCKWVDLKDIPSELFFYCDLALYSLYLHSAGDI